MASVSYKNSKFLETPETKFWQECRKRAQELGIPAWQLAEEGFVHTPLDTLSKRR